jgi:hypothetical protein
VGWRRFASRSGGNDALDVIAAGHQDRGEGRWQSQRVAATKSCRAQSADRPTPATAGRAHLAGRELDHRLRDEYSYYGQSERAGTSTHRPRFVHEFGIAVGDMARDFPIVVDAEGRKRRRRADIAIFAAGEHKRRPDGEIILTARAEPEWIRINGHKAERVFYRSEPELDNDLPVIAERYREFRARYPEPGARRPQRR